MPRISDYEDYLNELRHQFAISTGERQVELRELIFREISEQFDKAHEYQRDEKGEYEIDNGQESYEEACESFRQNQESQRYETESYQLASGDYS